MNLAKLLQVEHVVMQGADLSSILFRFDESDFAFAHFESLRMDGSDLLEDDGIGGGQITPNSILEDPLQYKASNGGSSAVDGGRGAVGRSDAAKRKKSGVGGGGGGGSRSFFPGIVLSLSNRRKGAPHRSPLS